MKTPPNAVDESVSQWIEALKGGDPESAQRLWDRFFERLVRLAKRKMGGYPRRVFDEEDVALSAFHSLCRGVEAGRFPNLQDRSNLWSLLVVITARKAMHRMRDQQTQRRGGAVDSNARRQVVGAMPQAEGIEQIIGKEPTPEFAAQVAEESQRLLEMLPDDAARSIAILKMEGHTNDEVAVQLGCGKRTVERRLELIRKVWSTESEDRSSV